jgi:hypothetical protein
VSKSGELILAPELGKADNPVALFRNSSQQLFSFLTALPQMHTEPTPSKAADTHLYEVLACTLNASPTCTVEQF